ncbi:MAG: hypothetical protein M0Z50_05800 [Planctomycetia bacterium]|nr:hypothetical protein [Planctomycetia bacterium]
MRKSDEQIKREFDAEVAITQAIQAKAEELRKARTGTSKYRDALVSVGLCNGVRTPKTRCYLYGLEKNRPEHYARFLEDEAEMVAYAEKLENSAVDLKIEKTGNVIYGAFRPFSQKNEKAGMSPIQREMAKIGISGSYQGLRLVK